MSDWTPSQQTQQEIQLFVQSLLERLPVLLGIDEAIAGCEVTNTDPYSTGAVPRYIKVRINDYLQDVYYRGVPQNLAVGDFVSVLHYRQGNIYEVFGSSGTTGATWQWKLLSPDGSIDPVIYTDNSGNTLTQTGAVLVGADANLTDFPEARLIVSQDDSGHSYAPNIAIVGESACDAATNAVGIGGVAKVVDNRQARGVVGRAVVDASSDTGEAIGVQGLSNPTHAGGTNIGVLGTAANGANNYSFYGEAGKIYNADDIVLAAGKLVDGVEVSIHDHSGGANMGVQIDIEDTTTTEVDDTKVLTPDGTGGVQWTAGGGGSGAPLIDSVNKTVKPGGGGDYTTIQAAVNYFKGKVITGACTITIDAGTYAENIVIEELLTSKDGALTLVGDTRALAGFCMIDGSTINPASKANGGSGTCSLTYGGNEIQVDGSTGDPDFDAGGVVAGDVILILANDGNIYERTVQEIPLITNIIICTTNVPAIGNTGTAVIIMPDRRIEPASGIALQISCANGIAASGIYAQSADSYGVYAELGGYISFVRSLLHGSTAGIYTEDDISKITLTDCAVVSGSSIEYPANDIGYTTYTTGSMLFADSAGRIAEDNDELFWDATNAVLGIGTNTPAAGVEISNTPKSATDPIGLLISTTLAGTNSNLGARVQPNITVASTSNCYGLDVRPRFSATSGTQGQFYGMTLIPQVLAAASSKITTGVGCFARFDNLSTAGAVVANVYGFQIGNPTATGAITNNYGLYINNQTAGGTINYAIYSLGGSVYLGGNTSIGTTNTTNSKLTIESGIAIKDGIAAPATSAGYAQIYVDTADGDLKVKFGDGTVKTLATDT